jgi:hypothetical protein
MKKALLPLLLLVSISAFADSQSIKIDRQFYGENSYGYIEGQSYQFQCKGDSLASAIVEHPHDSNGKTLQTYRLSAGDCLKALNRVDQSLHEYASEANLFLACGTIGTGTHACSLKP